MRVCARFRRRRKSTHRLGRHAGAVCFRELALVGVLVVLLERLHVLGDMFTEDAITMRLRIVLFALRIVAEEARFAKI